MKILAARSFMVLLLALGTTALAAAQGSIVGVASVIDGDTIEIHGQRIRLFGIDAPESSQLCRRPNGERWRCGQQASFALADRIGRATNHKYAKEIAPIPRRNPAMIGTGGYRCVVR